MSYFTTASIFNYYEISTDRQSTEMALNQCEDNIWRFNHEKLVEIGNVTSRSKPPCY